MTCFTRMSRENNKKSLLHNLEFYLLIQTFDKLIHWDFMQLTSLKQNVTQLEEMIYSLNCFRMIGFIIVRFILYY